MFRIYPPRLIFLILLFFLLDLSLLPVLSIGGVKPDIFILLVVFYAFYLSWERVPTFAVWVGLVKELLTNSFFGLETFSLGLPALLLHFGVKKLERENPYVKLLLTFLFSLCVLFIYIIVNSFIKDSFYFFIKALPKAVLIASYTTLLSPAIFYILTKIMSKRLKQHELF